MDALNYIELVVLLGFILVIGTYIVVYGIKKKWFSKIASTVKEAIAEAEKQFGPGSGEQKKTYVLEKVKEKCKELGIPYDTLYKLITKFIDMVIEHYNVIEKNK